MSNSPNRKQVGSRRSRNWLPECISADGMIWSNRILFLGVPSAIYFCWDKLTQFFGDVVNLPSDYKTILIVIFFVLGLFCLIFSAIVAFRYRTRKKGNDQPLPYFLHPTLLTPPTRNYRYSDRMAYIMAELAELVYAPFEKENQYIDKLEKVLTTMDESINDEKYNDKTPKIDSVYEWVQSLDAETATVIETAGEIKTERQLQCALKKGGFEYEIGNYFVSKKVDDEMKPVDEGFVAVFTGTAESGRVSSEAVAPFIVVAFRGTQKNFREWFNNLSPEPYVLNSNEGSNPSNQAKIHSGFRDSFNDVKCCVEKIVGSLQKEYAKEGKGELPVYLTGHSRGGVLATIAARELFSEKPGACYTYGAPRFASYEYYQKLHMPVYRVVNSSDVVPRMPPVTVLFFIRWPLRYIKRFFPASVSAIEWLENAIDMIDDYRHTGDMRYLTEVRDSSDLVEVTNGQYRAKKSSLKLIQNPNQVDTSQRFWRQVKASLGRPVKDHGMKIYRRKLAAIALERNL